MESILLVFLSSFLLGVNSHPRNSDVIPKDFYKRQILQPIPGYIPVYIKADEEPIIRSEKLRPDSSVHNLKVSEAGENHSKIHSEPKSATTKSANANVQSDRKESNTQIPSLSETSHSNVNLPNGSEESAQRAEQKLSNEKKSH